MDSHLAFVLAVAALLIVPGPTNTLLAASGAVAGFVRSSRLVLFELGGYLAAIGFYMAVLGPYVAQSPAFATSLKLLASAYLVHCAVRLWRDAGAAIAGDPDPVSGRRLFTTTLLNPKALIFAFVVFPPAGLPAVAPHVALFALSVLAIGSLWIAFGAVASRSAGGVATPRRVSRLAAAALGLFATVIATSAVAGF